jgi:hypothetical protein
MDKEKWVMKLLVQLLGALSQTLYSRVLRVQRGQVARNKFMSV